MHKIGPKKVSSQNPKTPKPQNPMSSGFGEKLVTIFI